MKEIQLLVILTFLFCSCRSIQYIEPTQNLTRDQVLEDIEFVKSKLVERHFDLNWDNKKDVIFSQLDSIANAPSVNNKLSLKAQLESVVNSIDKGYTRILSFEEGKLTKDNLNSQFCCIALNKKTVYLKIPNFESGRKLRSFLDKFEDATNQTITERIIIDLRNNQGGIIDNVELFLKYTLQYDTDFCMEQSTKRGDEFIPTFKNILCTLSPKYSISGDHLIRKCTSIKPYKNIHTPNKYLLVDSTIVSGGMFASYYLQKDGYRLIGNPPKSLFNSFGCAYSWILPNSNLYISISTFRIKLDENFKDRENDMLIPDIEVEYLSLNELVDFVEEVEKME